MSDDPTSDQNTPPDLDVTGELDTEKVGERVADRAAHERAADDEESGFNRHAFLTNVLDDVRTLALYAVQQGRLPNTVSIATLSTICDRHEQVTPFKSQEVATLAKYYQTLESEFPTISAQTLKATQSTNGDPMACEAGVWLRTLWRFVFVIFVLIVISNLTQYLGNRFIPDVGDVWPWWVELFDVCYQIARLVEPFTYGALGSCAYLLRVTEQRLRARDFDPAREPEHRNRLVLGTLSGGVIVLLVHQVPNSEGIAIQIADAALGFIAGYSVDFLFDTIDRIINSILPKVSYESMRRRDTRKKRLESASRYRKQAEQISDPEAKRLLNQLVEDFERS
jgi:hypothetical protein